MKDALEAERQHTVPWNTHQNLGRYSDHIEYAYMKCKAYFEIYSRKMCPVLGKVILKSQKYLP